MILLKYLCIIASPRNGDLHAGGSRTPAWPIVSWLIFLAIPTLILVLSAPFREEAFHPLGHGGTLPSPYAEQEQHRLQKFMDTLYAEGAVQGMSLCRKFDVCVQVTDLFRGLERSDKRSIGRGIRQYFETHSGGTHFVLIVRFIDARTGIEIGRYADNRLDWEGNF